MTTTPLASQRLVHRVLLFIFPGADSLDLIGFTEVLAEANRRLADAGRGYHYLVEIAAARGGPVETRSGIQLAAHNIRPTAGKTFDTVIFVGGDETANTPCTGAILELVRHLTRSARRVVATWTGVFPLARTGLLDGVRSTTHWSLSEAFMRDFPAVILEPGAVFVTDGKYSTCAGGTATIDLALAMVERDAGRATALAIARQLVVFIKRPEGEPQLSDYLRVEMDELDADRFAGLGRWIIDHLAEDLRVERLAAQAAMSPRNFARRFRDTIGTTPARYVQELRIDAAHRLLAAGNLPAGIVAHRCGFGTEEAMRLAFHRRLNLAPSDVRARGHGAFAPSTGPLPRRDTTPLLS